MDVVEYITAIDANGTRLASAAAVAGLDAAVPTCPDWLVRDLVRHQGGIHRWAASIVTGPRTEPFAVDLEDLVGAWPSDAALLEWFADGLAGLITALSDADPSLACWTFLEAPSPLEMWARRQAHETAVHRVDAELAAGGPTSPLAPGFSSDGVDELLACFITRPNRLHADPPRHLSVRCTDTPGAWLVRIGPDRVDTTREVTDGDCEVRGHACDLYLALWNRIPPETLMVSGDTTVLELFLDRVHIRWS